MYSIPYGTVHRFIVEYCTKKYFWLITLPVRSGLVPKHAHGWGFQFLSRGENAKTRRKKMTALLLSVQIYIYIYNMYFKYVTYQVRTRMYCRILVPLVPKSILITLLRVRSVWSRSMMHMDVGFQFFYRGGKCKKKKKWKKMTGLSVYKKQKTFYQVWHIYARNVHAFIYCQIPLVPKSVLITLVLVQSGLIPKHVWWRVQFSS